MSVALSFVASCFPQETGDFAVCCTCLAQKSPNGDGNAVDDTTNCLPDEETSSGSAEVDGCNEVAAEQIIDPDTAPPIFVVDENCLEVTFLEECAAARRQEGSFEVREESLSD